MKQEREHARLLRTLTHALFVDYSSCADLLMLEMDRAITPG